MIPQFDQCFELCAPPALRHERKPRLRVSICKHTSNGVVQNELRLNMRSSNAPRVTRTSLAVNQNGPFSVSSTQKLRTRVNSTSNYVYAVTSHGVSATQDGRPPHATCKVGLNCMRKPKAPKACTPRYPRSHGNILLSLLPRYFSLSILSLLHLFALRSRILHSFLSKALCESLPAGLRFTFTFV